MSKFPMCPECKSMNIVTDATADWDPTLQMWMVCDINDGRILCKSCERESPEPLWDESSDTAPEPEPEIAYTVTFGVTVDAYGNKSFFAKSDDDAIAKAKYLECDTVKDPDWATQHNGRIVEISRDDTDEVIAREIDLPF